MLPTPGRARQPGSGFCLMIPPYAGKDSVALHGFGGSAAFGAAGAGASDADPSAEEAEPDDSSTAATAPEATTPRNREIRAVMVVLVRRPNIIRSQSPL